MKNPIDRRFLIPAAAAMALAIATPPAARAQSGEATKPTVKTNTPVALRTLRWKHRVLIVYAPATEKAKADQARKLWAGAEAGLKERDMVFIDFADIRSQPAIAKRLNLREGQFALALIGKDGNVAFRSGDPVGPENIFAQIDGMPMRRDEMKARGETKR